MSMPAIRVLIADDHPLFRKGLHALLATRPEFEVIGEATTGSEAVELAAALQPDVVLWTSRCRRATASVPPATSPGAVRVCGC